MSVAVGRALPTAFVGACCVWLAVASGGFYTPTWAAATTVAAVLALVLTLAVWDSRARLSPLVSIALASMVLLTLWSFATALWAASPGAAWRGSVISALYLIAFAVPVLWPPTSAGGEPILLALVCSLGALGLVGVGLFVLGSGGSVYARLGWPTGYPNATAALFAVGVWIAFVLAARGSMGRVVRGAAFGTGIWLAGLLVLTQSRGAVFTAPIAAAVFVVSSPRRLQALAWLGLGFVLLAPAVPLLARVVGTEESARVDALVRSVVVLSFVALLAVPAHVLLQPAFMRIEGRKACTAIGVGLVVICAIALLVTTVRTDPSARVVTGWRDFTTTATGPQGATRFTGLGSNRADFWRVGRDGFVRHPIGGLGVDNFQAAYLKDRRTEEQPRFSHSLAVRAVSETGLVGAGLLAVFISALALAFARVARRAGRAGTVSQATMVALAGWLAHANLDWLWEMPATGALAFAVAGIGAGAVAADETRPVRPVSARKVRVAVAFAAAAVGLAAGTLWLATRYEERGIERWRASPTGAVVDLRRAAWLDPLASSPLVYQGVIAAREQRWTAMHNAFEAALARDPSDWYAWLGLALADVRLGERAAALAAAERAARLNPREPLASGVVAAIERGEQPDLLAIDRALITRTP